MEPFEILKYFEGRRSAMVSAIGELVDIESPTFNEGQSIKLVDTIASDLGSLAVELDVERVFQPGIGEHLVIRSFQSEERPILLLGHTDTVHPVGSAAENPTRIDGDRFYGCGIFDMKANIILMLEALRFFSLNKIRPAKPINILLSCDEETGSQTGRSIVEKEAAAAAECLVFEPSAGGSLKTGRKGTGVYVIKTHGIPAHAGLEPERGASAVLEIARQIDLLHKLNEPELGTTVNVCLIKGGTASNVIPENAECSVDVRFSTMEEAQRMDTAIKSLTSIDERVSLEVIGGINRPPMERSPGVAKLFERAVEKAGSIGYILSETQVGGASDGNFVAAIGTPLLDGLGISGDGAHTLNEYINVSDIPPRAALITMMLM